MTDKSKVRCGGRHCDWRGYEHEVLRAPNPFAPDDEIWGCPECRGIETMLEVCDEPGCWRETSCGTPTKNGYRYEGYHHG